MKYWSYLYLSACHQAYTPDHEPQSPVLRALLSDTKIASRSEAFQGLAMCTIITIGIGNSIHETLKHVADNLAYMFRNQNGYAASKFRIETTFYSQNGSGLRVDPPAEVLQEFGPERHMEFEIRNGIMQFQI